MLVAGFDLATGILPGAELREYGSRASTEAGGHRRGARCMGSTVLQAPEVLVEESAGHSTGSGFLLVQPDDLPGAGHGASLLRSAHFSSHEQTTARGDENLKVADSPRWPVTTPRNPGA